MTDDHPIERGVAVRELTADQQVTFGPCLVWGWHFVGSADSSTVELHDGTNASAPRKLRLDASTSPRQDDVAMHRPLRFEAGLYAEFSAGSNARLAIYFEPLID